MEKLASALIALAQQVSVPSSGLPESCGIGIRQFETSRLERLGPFLLVIPSLRTQVFAEIHGVELVIEAVDASDIAARLPGCVCSISSQIARWPESDHRKMIVATLCSSECQPVLDWVATVGARSFLALSHVSNTLEEVVGPNFGASAAECVCKSSPADLVAMFSLRETSTGVDRYQLSPAMELAYDVATTLYDILAGKRPLARSTDRPWRPNVVSQIFELNAMPLPQHSTSRSPMAFSGASAARNGKVIFAPKDADGVGVFDAVTSTFEIVDIGATLDGVASKFSFAVETSDGMTSDRLVVFAPFSADGVGVFNAARRAFLYIDISSTIGSIDNKFSGAAVAGAQVIFAPYDADGVGIFDTITSTFSYTDLNLPPTSAKFCGAASISSGHVVFAPHNMDAVGVFDPATSSISLADISQTLNGTNKFCGAVAASNDLVIFAPYDAGGVGLFDAPTSAFWPVDISDNVNIGNKFSGAALAGHDLVVFAPSAANGVGVFDTATMSFAYTDISMTVSTASKFSGAATASNGQVVFAPHDADGVGTWRSSLGEPDGEGWPGGTWVLSALSIIRSGCYHAVCRTAIESLLRLGLNMGSTYLTSARPDLSWGRVELEVSSMLPDVLQCGCAMNWDALHALVVTEALQHATSRSSTDAMGLYDLDEQLAALLNNVLGANFSVSPGLHGLAARLAQTAAPVAGMCKQGPCVSLISRAFQIYNMPVTGPRSTCSLASLAACMSSTTACHHPGAASACPTTGCEVVDYDPRLVWAPSCMLALSCPKAGVDAYSVRWTMDITGADLLLSSPGKQAILTRIVQWLSLPSSSMAAAITPLAVRASDLTLTYSKLNHTASPWTGQVSSEPARSVTPYSNLHSDATRQCPAARAPSTRSAGQPYLMYPPFLQDYPHGQVMVELITPSAVVMSQAASVVDAARVPLTLDGTLL